MHSDPLVSFTQKIRDPLSEAYQHWQSVRTRLAHIIQDYVDACNDLSDALSHHPTRGSLEQTLADVDAELSGLERDYERLSQAHAIVSRNRNQSKKLVPANGLPTEILSRIFQYAAYNCVEKVMDRSDGPSYLCPSVLASVCSMWRETAINLPLLWSHIDLAIDKTKADGCYCHTRIYSERSKNIALYLHVSAMGSKSADEYCVTELLVFLAANAKQIQFLDVCSTQSMEHLGQRILTCWIKHGHPGVSRALRLEVADSGLQSWDPMMDASISPVQIEEFFRSIESLDLNGFHVPWESEIYHGLVRLSLNDTHRPTQSQLTTVLQSSPQLRELDLVGALMQPEEWVTQEPIVLKDLEALAVYDDLALVLPMIAPGSKPMTVTIFVDEDPLSPQAVYSFFGRSIISTLNVENHFRSGIRNWFPFVLGPLEHLSTLVILGCWFDFPEIHDLLAKSPEENPNLWPKLHTLNLSDCLLDGDIVHDFLSTHPVQVLELRSCLTNDDWELGEDESNMLEVKELLTNVVPNVVLYKREHGDPYQYQIFDT
ncbi:hypothetical protein BDV93DRAFT_605338 [Ceratobasidium sp. AG-I]|nr:hypothetical protein BDV93DRAFT_605338 [Ceratobasidium sp. AG-I]